ncbi:LIM-domain-containing protein [Trametopsis cervina]|nr:LIM-domain-containing protein [Trametopsis cervina]
MVYAAEQVMGPGRKLYHKPCLTCTSCRKRLDSNLVEHDEEPYCKNCHSKNFGTRDLRQANLPDRNDVFGSPPTSPTRSGTMLPPISRSPPSRPPALPARKVAPGNTFGASRAISPTPIFRPTHSYSPVRPISTERSLPEATLEEPKEAAEAEAKDDDWEPPVVSGAPSHTGRGTGGLPRTVPLDSAMTASARSVSPVKAPATPTRPVPSATDVAGESKATPNARITVPLAPMTTGTRYGSALTGRMASPMTPMATGRQWGGGTPVCPKCQKSVYFAEQIKALGKTYHRNCLRCTGCNTSLDSSRLTEKEGEPYCHHCYGKLYGPLGNGYALLGKAGG